MVDGPAGSQHYGQTAEIGGIVKGFASKQSGAEGTFGDMVFSHDLVHQIGGETDTNRNTTRRLLLLLESRAVSRSEAHERVVRQILNRYLLEDRGFWKGSQYRVPRFLQNDFARYWRTTAVDFAYKLRKRSGDGWAIRNLKLRMSRKLLYVSGLLACYQCHLDHDERDWRLIGQSLDRAEIINYFQGVFRQTPLEIVAGVLGRYPHLEDAARKIMGSYDSFLGILADESRRHRLESLLEDEGDADEVYQEARRLSHVFGDGLLELFFDAPSGIDTLTRNYGVF